MQIFAETFVVAVISFVASIPFSNLITEKAGAFLVSRVATGTVNLNVQINEACLLPMYLIGILVVTVSVIGSLWTVVRLQPKDIFMKMS